MSTEVSEVNEGSAVIVCGTTGCGADCLAGVMNMFSYGINSNDEDLPDSRADGSSTIER